MNVLATTVTVLSATKALLVAHLKAETLVVHSVEVILLVVHTAEATVVQVAVLVEAIHLTPTMETTEAYSEDTDKKHI